MSWMCPFMCNVLYYKQTLRGHRPQQQSNGRNWQWQRFSVSSTQKILWLPFVLGMLLQETTYPSYKKQCSSENKMGSIMLSDMLKLQPTTTQCHHHILLQPTTTQFQHPRIQSTTTECQHHTPLRLTTTQYHHPQMQPTTSFNNRKEPWASISYRDLL